MLYIRFVRFCMLLYISLLGLFSTLHYRTIPENLVLECSFFICFTRLWGTFDQDSAC